MKSRIFLASAAALALAACGGGTEADTAPADPPSAADGLSPVVRYQVLCRRHYVRGELGSAAPVRTSGCPSQSGTVVRSIRVAASVVISRPARRNGFANSTRG